MTHKEFAIGLAHESGKIMLAAFRSDSNTKTYKEDETPVTVADQEINDLVRTRIAGAYPDHGFLGEEGGAPDGQEYVWVCDPIDGTRSFARGVPVSVFSLALVQDGVPVLGVVYQPFVDDLYVAESEKGATCNGQKIFVSERAEIDTRSVIAAAAHKKTAPYPTDNIVRLCADKGASIYNYGSATYNAVLVARGSAEATVFPYSNAWDMAAAKVIIEESGGHTSSVGGKRQRYDGKIAGFIGSNKLVHEKLLHFR